MKTNLLRLYRNWLISFPSLFLLIFLVMRFYHRPPLDYLLAITSILFCFLLCIQYRKDSKYLFQIILIYLCFNGFLVKALDIIRDKTTSFDFYYNFKAFEKIREIERYSPSKPFRVVTYGLPQGVAVYHGFQSADMEHNYYPTTYYNFWKKVLNDGRGINPKDYQAYLNGETYHNITLSMPKSDELRYQVKDLFFNVDLLALMNIKYLVSRAIIESPARYHLEPLFEEAMVSCRSFEYNWEGFKCRTKKYFRGPRASLYRLTQTADRFFVVSKVKVFETPEALNKSLETSSLQELKTHLYTTRDAKLILDNTTPDPSQSSAAPGKLVSGVDSIDYTPDRIELSAFVKAPGYLIMTDTYSPRWECTDNGSKTPMIPAYGTFRAIRLMPGRHDIACHFVDLPRTISRTIARGNHGEP